ncbi:unnamed protein product [Prorocentrum cordatum]|uniref:Dynamin GTPase domain-containing protein n=1 Tax=Prorocentrum cordatum TaxID=2364126 RepID=A0ABN9TSH1_9DINO|nr:unnamed protein product [Polarella glacialis]
MGTRALRTGLQNAGPAMHRSHLRRVDFCWSMEALNEILSSRANSKCMQIQFRHDIVDLPHESKRLNASMQQLEDLVAMLDSVQPRVAQVIDGWTPPHVVVLGLESSGKSTLLERLLKLPVFPRAPNVCTRMPIRVQVRRGGSQVGIVLSIVERETKTKIEGPIMLRQDDSEERIRDTMNKMVCGTDNGYVTDKELEIVVTSPVLPPINMIDLPGLVAAPADAATATNALAREYIRRYKENSVFLLVGQASLEPHLSVAYALVHPQGIEDRCIGVLTKMDEIHQMDPRLIDILKGSAEPPKAQLKPHGFIGTANPYTELQANESPMVRLYHGERREVEQLEAMGLRGHGVVEILSRVRVLYKEKMLNDMVPNVVACLLSNRADVKRKHAELGLPVANGILDTDQVLDDDQLQRLSEKIGERLLTLTGVYEEQAQAIQTKEKERLQQTLWEHMLKQHQGFNTAGFSQCPCRSSVSRQKSHSLSQCRVDLLKMCQKSVKNLSADLQANLDEVFCDDATPLRLQRFPSIVSEMKRELSIQLTVSDSLYDVVFSVFRLSQELGGDGSEFPLCIQLPAAFRK